MFRRSKKIIQQLDFVALASEITVNFGWFWDALVISQADGKVFRFGGVKKTASKQLQANLNQQFEYALQHFYQQFAHDLSNAIESLEPFVSGLQYIHTADAQQWLSDYRNLNKGFVRQDYSRYLPANALQHYQLLQPFALLGMEHFSNLNQDFITKQLKQYRLFFDNVETNPLTAQQRRACVIDEKHNLVLAGAGTGKTSTMVARAGYLVKAGLAKPEQILMLAYARKAADEMEERIKDQLGIEKLSVKTFHSLGKHIITQVEDMVPLIDKMAEDTALRVRFVDEQIQLFLQDDRYKSRFVSYFVKYSHPYKSQYAFKSLGAYNAYLKENDIRTLQGELVKSFEECEIANFLYRQGIAYQYEAQYQINTTSRDFKAYQPDFFLTDYGIYIEHFAVNEQNQTPPFIDQQRYLEEMAWKRELHQRYQTPLIETYSYLKHQGRLTDVLSEKLLAAGVQFKPQAANTLLNKLNQLGRVSEFSQLMAQILALFKSAYLNIKSFMELAGQHEDHERMRAATYLFEPIYEAYQQQLRDAASIDFEDMIGLAIEYVESCRYKSPYKYLLVDEFQDISASRARLLKALMAQNPDSSLFCVGDDWQSIYRFSGSDVAMTQHFEQYFGATATSILDKTFRFNNKIGEVAARFITQNPEQIPKQISSHRTVKHNAVSLIKTNQDLVGMHAALSAIADQVTQPATVLLLARFHFKKPDIVALNRQYPNLRIQFMSVHASKGKEADYVLIFGLEKGKHGFPSEKATHPLLTLLLPKAEPFPYAEERRLFYVALTRARHHVYLIADANNASVFVRELLNKPYPVSSDEFIGKEFQETVANTPCSHCQTGFMVPKDSQYGSFLGCSEYPLCPHTQRACQRCGSGLLDQGGFRVCENKRCDYREPICPECGGTLSLRKGKYGEFWGCSNYRKDADFSCGYTAREVDMRTTRVM
jgi:DNA helicase-4